uniref:Dimethylargininase n=1 Tax=Rhabditophanes sp. KR3021 TaxID=114890 RepID=A0AC35UA70_9BILA
MKFSHAIMIRLPDKVKFENKKVASHFDLPLAKKQLEDLTQSLKEAGIDVIELAPEHKSRVEGLFPDDAAVVIHGTALITRPKKTGARLDELAVALKELTWNVIRCEDKINGKGVVLEGSDVLYTGREIFVGIRKDGTNIEGSIAIARSYPDIPVIPITLPSKLPLKHYICMVKDDVFSVIRSKDSEVVLERITREATYRYKVLFVEKEESVNCLNVNDHLIFRCDVHESKFGAVKPPVELWGVKGDELAKMSGGMLSRYCLLIKKINTKKGILS